jgi:hypothetical protein
MNENIKELARKSDVYVEEDWMFAEELNPRSEHFAQLIVKACGNFTDPVTRNLMFKHFGVDDNQIKVGSRIEVISGFHVGARGTVNYIEPSGRMWVRRDGASSDVFYNPEEVIGVEDV